MGESVHEVAKPEYAFDRIVCFEPVASCLLDLEKVRAKDPRIEICPFGLSDRSERVMLANAGELGGSVFATGGRSELVQMVDAAKWFEENLGTDDFVIVKTNCEGGEIDIVNRLLDRELMGLPYIFLITFDIRDYPKHRHKEVKLRRRLVSSGLNNFCFSDDVMIGTTHEKRLEHWLKLYWVNHPEKSVEELKECCNGTFRYYSSRTGTRQRLEQRAKELLGYSAMPAPIKSMLRRVKSGLGLSREREVLSGQSPNGHSCRDGLMIYSSTGTRAITFCVSSNLFGQPAAASPRMKSRLIPGAQGSRARCGERLANAAASSARSRSYLAANRASPIRCCSA